MRWTHLVILMDAEAARQEEANDHSAAILLREGAEAIRKANRAPGVGMATLDQLIMTSVQVQSGNGPFKGARPTPTPDPLMRDRTVT